MKTATRKQFIRHRGFPGDVREWRRPMGASMTEFERAKRQAKLMTRPDLIEMITSFNKGMGAES